jgi:hypothetical protein
VFLLQDKIYSYFQSLSRFGSIFIRYSKIFFDLFSVFFFGKPILLVILQSNKEALGSLKFIIFILTSELKGFIGVWLKFGGHGENILMYKKS